MTGDDAAIRRWFMRIVGGLTYVLLGLVILALWSGRALLGYEGGFAADMAAAALPIFMVIWALLFPFFLAVGYVIEIALTCLGFIEQETELR